MGENSFAAPSALNDIFSFELRAPYGSPWVAIGGRLVQWADAVVSVNDRGLMYGDGIYTTMRVSFGRPLFLKRHMDRLQRDMNRLMFGACVDVFDLPNMITSLIAANEIYSGYVRVQITRGLRMNFPSLEAKEPTCICLAGTLPPSTHKSLSTVTCPDPRDVYRESKTSNRIAALFSLREATLRGAGEAIFVDKDGPVEATCHNIFAQVNGRLVTPPLIGRGLRGIVRQVLLDAKVAIEADFSFSEANCLFLTNCLLEIVLPIHAVDGRHFDVDWETCDIVSKVIRRCANDDI